MPTYRRFEDLDCSGKRVLLRAGFDVEIKDGRVTDRTRIESIVPTIKAILRQGASLVILAHQDRPKGRVVLEMSQKPLVPVLEELLGTDILFADDCIGAEARTKAKNLKPGEVLLLENLRFHAGEEANDPAFAAALAALGEVSVCDAFSNAHRAHASMTTLQGLLPSAMGLQMQHEVDALSGVRDGKKLCVIVCGKKLETKVPVIESFLGHAETIVVGGAIANTFLKAVGKDVGLSLFDVEEVPVARRILESAGSTLLLPVDTVVHRDAILDLGPASIAAIERALSSAQTIVWNGPVGYTEEEAFAKGSIAVAHMVAAATKRGALTVIGGGDTIEFHVRYGLPLDAYSFVSTGGGAMLDFLAGKELPALEALRTAE